MPRRLNCGSGDKETKMADKPKDTADDGLQPPSLTIDWELCGTYLEDSDLSDAKKREFIETLWSIVVSFVDLGFGVHPVQQACEQNGIERFILPDDVIASVKDIPHNQDQDTADDTDSHAAAEEES